jgi:antitoxin MazE
MRVARWGNSLAVRIPQALAEQARLEEGAEVEVTLERDGLAIRRRPPRYTLDELVDQITPENRHAETDWGEPQGDEVW